MKTLSTGYKARLADPNQMASVKWDIRVYVLQEEWVSTSDHSQGFNTLNTIEITDYLEFGQLQSIVEQIENDIEGESGYGTIVANQFNQEFSEATENTDSVDIGTLLRTIRSEQDTPHYEYDGDSIHKWTLRIRLGDTSTTDYVEYNYILGWLFDTNDTQPRWIGCNRSNASIFTLTACGLLYWLKDVGSKAMGDYSSPACQYTGGEVSGNNYLVGVYPLVPLVREMLNLSGVIDDNITLLKIPPETGSQTSSTIDYLNYEGISSPDYHIPQPVPIREDTDVDGNTLSYTLWHPGWGSTSNDAKIYVSVYNVGTGYEETEELNLYTINSSMSNGVVRKIWNDGSGTDYYLLVEVASNDYRCIKLVLDSSSEIGEFEDEATVTISGLITNETNYSIHWGQMDIDQGNSVMYANQCYNTAGDKYLDIGYWDLVFSATGAGTSSWNSLWNDAGFSFKAWGGQASYWTYVTGFRALFDGSTGNTGICFLCVEGSGSDVGDLYVGCWDVSGNGGNPEFIAYGGGSPINSVWDSVYVTEGRGTIGGLRESGNNDFYFFLPGHNGDGSINKFNYYYVTWTSGDDTVGNASLNQYAADDNHVWRTFSSVGSGDFAFCMGWRLFYRELDSGDNDYSINLAVGFFYYDGAITVDYNTSFTVADDIEWPLISAPCQISDTALGASARTTDETRYFKPFTYHKKFTGSDSRDYERAFLTIYSTYHLPCTSYDFYTDNPNMATAFKRIAQDFGLIMNLSHENVIIRPRNDTDDADMTMTANQYEFDGQSSQDLKGYDHVIIHNEINDTDYEASSGNEDSKNVLEITTGFLLPPRSQARANNLFTEWKYNQVLYRFKAVGVPQVEPGDKVTIPVTDPAFTGYTSITGMVHRNTTNQLDNLLEVRTVDITGATVQ